MISRGLIVMLCLIGSRNSLAEPASDVAVTVPVLELLDPSGALDVPTVQGALGKLAPGLAACGSAAGWTGDALAWIVVDWHGKVAKLELAVDRPAVEACFTSELQKLTIPHAQGRATVFARLHLAAAK